MVSVVASVYIFNHPVTIFEFELSLGQATIGTHYYYLAEVFYTITAAFLRITVGLLLLRIAHTRPQKITIYTAMTFMVLMSTAFLFFVIFQCNPVGYYWDWTPGAKGTCSNYHALTIAAYVFAGISFASDWALGLLPMWLLWNVQISRSKKFGVGVMLGLGLLCGVAAIVRVVYVSRLTRANFDLEWVGLGLCSVIEPGLGIIAASVAAFRPLFASQWFTTLTSRSSSTRKSTHRRMSSDRSAKKQNEKTLDTGFTGTTLGEGPIDGSGSGEGGSDEEHGIRVHHKFERRESGL
jgi:hypothetical protein